MTTKVFRELGCPMNGDFERVRYDLVYQCGLANVFRCQVPHVGSANGVQYHRVMQGDYGSCEAFSRGLIEAGMEMSVWHSDVAGDVLACQRGPWQMGRGSMFGDKKRPPVQAAYSGE